MKHGRETKHFFWRHQNSVRSIKENYSDKRQGILRDFVDDLKIGTVLCKIGSRNSFCGEVGPVELFSCKPNRNVPIGAQKQRGHTFSLQNSLLPSSPTSGCPTQAILGPVILIDRGFLWSLLAPHDIGASCFSSWKNERVITERNIQRGTWSPFRNETQPLHGLSLYSRDLLCSVYENIGTHAKLQRILHSLLSNDRGVSSSLVGFLMAIIMIATRRLER